MCQATMATDGKVIGRLSTSARYEPDRVAGATESNVTCAGVLLVYRDFRLSEIAVWMHAVKRHIRFSEGRPRPPDASSATKVCRSFWGAGWQ
jgi:hypothetical protein